jgi:hypothetical protein
MIPFGETMSILRIETGSETEKRLLQLPESGMGYQVVQHEEKPWVVFNSTVTMPLHELNEMIYTERDYLLFSGDPNSRDIRGLPVVDFERDFPLLFSILDPEYRDTSSGLNFCPIPITPSMYGFSPNWRYSYYRFCSYSTDKRVDPSGDFLPGTYATTYNDLHFTPSGHAAVGRYALPNPASACFISSILTFTRPALIGTATPNFGQAGGGVEVLFDSGATNQPGVSFMINVG